MPVLHVDVFFWAVQLLLKTIHTTTPVSYEKIAFILVAMAAINDNIKFDFQEPAGPLDTNKKRASEEDSEDCDQRKKMMQDNCDVKDQNSNTAFTFSSDLSLENV